MNSSAATRTAKAASMSGSSICWTAGLADFCNSVVYIAGSLARTLPFADRSVNEFRRQRFSYSTHGVTRQSHRKVTGEVQTRSITIAMRSEEHTSELQSLMRISYAVFCLKKKIKTNNHTPVIITNI